MSVPKNQRGLSKMEFFHKAYEISDKVTTLLIRNFGGFKRSGSFIVTI